jgi:hypothetical protein
MDQQNLPLAGPRVSRISIGRLHNLGNYEHVRYEVTVELPPGTSPASVARELTEILDGLEPRAPYSASEVRLALVRQRVPAPKLADFGDDHWQTPAERLAAAQRERDRADQVLTRYAEWQKARDAALARFDHLGGTRLFTDAKDRWEDE